MARRPAAVWSKLLRMERIDPVVDWRAYSIVRPELDSGIHSFRNVGGIFCRREWVVRDASRWRKSYVGTRDGRNGLIWFNWVGLSI